MEKKSSLERRQRRYCTRLIEIITSQVFDNWLGRKSASPTTRQCWITAILISETDMSTFHFRLWT